MSPNYWRALNSFPRKYFREVFSPDISVEPSSQVLDMFEHASGLILGLASISTENQNIKKASKQSDDIDIYDYELLGLGQKNF